MKIILKVFLCDNDDNSDEVISAAMTMIKISMMIALTMVMIVVVVMSITM